MMDGAAVTLEDVHVKYRFVENVSLKNELVRLFARGKKERRVKEIPALQGVSFAVRKGGICGVIGPNGAGKSTLLKLIAGIFEPDSGSVRVHGGSVSLLSLGAGFMPDLTGEENAYLNGLLLGLKKKEIDGRLKDIMEFSGVGEFFYKPVKSYSTGMRSRLSFSVAAHVEPEILLIDEVLGVGDEAFKRKSAARIRELIAHSNTVMIVSHGMDTIRSMCDTAVWLDAGRVVQTGPAATVAEEYVRAAQENGK